MKKIVAALLGAAAIVSVAACADDYYGYGGGYYASGSPYYYDGYYDDFYGPAYGGYWGGDGFFYYQRSAGRPFVRDNAHHFRRDAAIGYHAFHMQGPQRHDRPSGGQGGNNFHRYGDHG